MVALGETDDWAHAGRYDLYLSSARMNDDLIRRLWELVQSMDAYRDRTALVIATDHGRGDGQGRVEGSRRRTTRIGGHLDCGYGTGH